MTTGSVDKRTAARGVATSDPANPAAREATSRAGDGQFMNAAAPGRTADSPPAGGRATDGVTLNFAGASIADVAQTVLGEMLGLNYAVSDRVQGAITLQTPRPIPRRDVLPAFEAVLKAEGAVIVVESGVHRIVPAAEAGPGNLRRAGGRDRTSVGVGSEVISLRHVVPDDMQRLVSAMAPSGVKLTGDANRNLLIVSGTPADVAAVRDLVAVFDVDWMRGTSFGLYPVEAGDPEAIAQELDTIFANDRSSPIKGMVRFIPNKRLKSILIVTSRAEYLRRAEAWLKRVDLVGQESEKQVHVYRVLHRPAGELAALLQRVYNQAGLRNQAGRAGLPPGTSATTISSEAEPAPGSARPAGLDTGVGPGGGSSGGPRPQPLSPATPSIAPVTAPASSATPTPAIAVPVQVQLQEMANANAAPAKVPDDRTSGIEVLADEPNNALIITATAREFKRVRQTLARMDIAPAQVLLETTIAEVTLNDRLQHGLRWYFQRGNSSVRLTDEITGAVAARVPGFSYFLNAANVQVALNALSDVTDVNIVSSPSMMVIDNKRAQLQIGDEVPIATQSAVSVGAPGAPIVNSVAFRNTGVILNITPQIGEDGRITLDIEQEVSDVVPTTSSNIDSPTIQQRRIKTKVAVGSGETIVLAGFMQDRASRGRQQVPLLGDVPVLGNLFKDKTDTIKRTELLIAITPQIIKDSHQIRNVASEFRDRINLTTRPQRTAPPDRREQIERVVVR